MMIKRKHLLFLTSLAFVLFEGWMFYLIHISNVDIAFNRYYDCIIAAAIFALSVPIIRLITKKEDSESVFKILFGAKGGNLLRIAMLFTLGADYFLVGAEEENKVAGVTVFLGTQLFIFLHIYFNDESKKWRVYNTLFRLIITVGAVITAYAVLGDEVDYLATIAVIYYANLISNAIFAHRVGRGGFMLTVGLILFALCDINVGILALDNIYGGNFPEGSLLYILRNTEVDLMWLFYIPSQTLIPLTLVFYPKSK